MGQFRCNEKHPFELSVPKLNVHGHRWQSGSLNRSQRPLLPLMAMPQYHSTVQVLDKPALPFLHAPVLHSHLFSAPTSTSKHQANVSSLKKKTEASVFSSPFHLLRPYHYATVFSFIQPTIHPIQTRCLPRSLSSAPWPINGECLSSRLTAHAACRTSSSSSW